MIKNNKIKLVALFLILSVILISCGTDEAPAPDNNNNVAVNDTNNGNGGTGNDTTLLDIFPYPEHDFGGAVINFLARQDGWADGSQDFEDIMVEAETGEVLNDNVFRRTRLVEEKYNVQIEVTYVENSNDVIARSVRAGDDEYQIVQEKLVFISSNLAPQNFLFDLNTVGSINLDAPWYNQNAIKDLSINNKVTVLGGDITVSDKIGVLMTVFNKRIAADFGIENLYETVRQDRWTLDKLYELMVQTTVDLNGDGIFSIQDDQFGFAAENYGGWMLSIASGNRLARLDENGLPYMTVVTEKAVNDYDRIKRIMYETPARASVDSTENHERVFADGRYFLTIGALSQFTALRAMEEDFGIIPLPKQDENQQNYITSISPWISRFLAMPTTVGNPEMVGAVIDAMARESMNTVMLAYYNNLLENKIARDEASVEMLKMIFDSVIYDIGSVFNWGGIWDQQHTFITSRNQDFVGFHERIEGGVQAALDRTIEAMQGFD